MNIRRGFTLVELLVVIIMIGILMAVIQPMLSVSSSKSRELMCESNLKQLGMAAYSYAEDYAAYARSLNQVDTVLQDRSLLVCPGNSRRYYYAPPQPDASPMTPIASCVNPSKAHGDCPHHLCSCYLQLTAGGSVLRITPK